MARRPNITTVFVVLSGACVAGLGALAHAGDLTPPAGPVTPAMKSLDQVEPRTPISATTTPGDANSLFKITAPGSYYLTGNITGVAGKHAIEVGADDVSIDLMGYTLRGVPDSLDGIARDGAARSNISIANGTIRDWGSDGIDLFLGSQYRLVDVRCIGNVSFGAATSDDTLVERCSFSNNTTGLFAGNNAIIRDSTASHNSSTGMQAFLNGAITNCTSVSNDGNGISIGAGTVSECVAISNGLRGIGAGVGTLIRACTARSNGAGGILAGEDCTVRDCVATSNTLSGIEAGSGCLVIHNTCRANGINGGWAGVYVTGTFGDSRIEGNNCTANGTGFQINTSGNLIVGNTASGNTTNYVFGINNRYGPIIDLTSGATSGVGGNAATGTLTTSDPNANYAY